MEFIMDTNIIKDLFLLGIPVFEKILRMVIVYIFLVVGLRLAGKRELAQLNPFDLVVLLTLSNTVQNAIIGNDNSVIGGIISAATLLIMNYFVVRYIYGHKKLEQIIEGSEDVLVENGHPQLDRLSEEVITLSELESAAHKQGFTSLDEVERAILEPGGTISFIGRKPAPEAERYQEIISRLDHILLELSNFQASRMGGQAS
jgi:uncharacterized membrane protein YcaP (DUF421 family)